MTPMLRTVIVDSDPGSAAALKRLLAGIASVLVVGEFSRFADAIQEAPSRRPDLVIVEAGEGAAAHNGGAPARIVESLARALPDAALFATGPGMSAELVIQVIRAGAVEFLRQPVEREELVAALDKVLRIRRGTAPPRQAGHIVSVFSTKGGLGVTTVATNLAVCLGEQAPGDVLLIDMDTRQSDVATFLNLRHAYCALDAFENLERLDESFLRALLVRRGGLLVLPGPSRIERAQPGAEQVQVGLEIIRTHFDHVVLDLRHDMDPGTIAALEASDTILFLTSLDVSALRSAAAGLAAFRHLGLDLQKVKVVVMREDTGKDVTLKHAREALALPVYWKTPSDYPAVVASINAGEPVVTASSRSKIARSLRQLAGTLIHATRGPEPAGGRAASLMRLVWAPRGVPGAG